MSFRRPIGFTIALACACLQTAARADDFGVAVAAARSPKVSKRLPLYFQGRPSVTGGFLAASARAPVVVEVTSVDVARLEQAGLDVSRREDGTPVVRERFVAGLASPRALAKLALLPEVRRVHDDGSPFGLLPPLDVLGPEVQAPDVWRQLDALGLPVSGAGQTVCIIDVGLDVHHPVFFRPDGGYWAWKDIDRDGVFTSGVDTTTSGLTLRTFKSIVLDPEGGALFDSGSDRHIADIHWVYADLNENGRRDFGADAGFSDASPSFGEPLYIADDVNDNHTLDAGERLVALGSSKVRAYNNGVLIYARGENLNEAPREGTYHGTASSSIVAGGQRGLTRFTGVAPEVELVAAKIGQADQLFRQTDFCLNQGARVILHEYAPWQGVFLDGSSPLEQTIASSMSAGVAHINPAGNLAGAQKMYKNQLARGQTLDIAIEVPADFAGEPFGLLAFSLLWPGAKDDLAITLRDATGHQAVIEDQDAQPFHSGLFVVNERVESDRGTARADIYVYGDQEGTVKLSPGRWTVSVSDSADDGPYQLLASLQDDESRWDKGIHFPDFANEDHLVGYPGTADSAIVVAAYTGQGYSGGVPGTRAVYSGRGTRIDGLALLSVAAPDDPIAAAHFDGFVAPFAVFGGTSAASPHVAGAAALVLQHDPTLTGVGVRDTLRAGALADEATGAVPNSDWGHGKLRIYQSLYGQAPPGGSPPTVSVPRVHVDAGDTVTLTAAIADAEDDLSTLTIELDRDYDGVYDEVLASGTFTVSSDDVGAHFLKLRVTDPTGRSGETLARVDVHSTYLPSGGLACQLSPPTRRPSGWLFLLALAAFGGRRRLHS